MPEPCRDYGETAAIPIGKITYVLPSHEQDKTVCIPALAHSGWLDAFENVYSTTSLPRSMFI